MRIAKSITKEGGDINMKVRNLLKGRGVAYSFIVGTLVLLVLIVFLPACAPAPEETGLYGEYVSSLPEGCEPVPRECFEQAMEEGELHFYNWAEWWPEDIYQGFSQEFGINFVPDYFGDYDEMVAKYKLDPKINHDLTYPDQRGFRQLRELGVVENEINYDWLPNVKRYLSPEVAERVWDDVRGASGYYKYSLPVEFGFVNYVYNSKYIDESDPRLSSWALLFEGEEYAGKISMKNDMFDCIGSALKYLGYSWNSDDEEELMEAKEVLLRQKPWVMAYESWPIRLLLEEEAWISHSWTGDSWFINQEDENIMGVLPVEGSLISTDTFIMPIGCTHPAAAHLFMNYVFRPEINALLMETIGYTPTHTATPELLSEELRKWPGVLYPEGYLNKCEIIDPRAYTGKGLELRTEIWEELKT